MSVLRAAYAKAKLQGFAGGEPDDVPPRSVVEQVLQPALSAASAGTAAVVVAYFARLDALGNAHIDLQQFQLGWTAILPLIALDLLFLGPNWGSDAPFDFSSKRAEVNAADNHLRIASTGAQKGPPLEVGTPSSTDSAEPRGGAQPGAQAEEAKDEAKWLSETVTDIKQAMSAEKARRTARPRSTWRKALTHYQVAQFTQNAGLGMTYLEEGSTVLFQRIAAEMLYRGVALSFLWQWIDDRLQEGGVDSAVWLSGDAISTSDLAKAYGVAVAAAVPLMLALAKLARREATSRMMQQALKSQVEDLMEKRAATKAGSGGKDGDSSKDGSSAALNAEQIFRSASAVKTVEMFIDGGMIAVETLTCSALFLATGNLVVPIAAALVRDSLYCVLQRLGMARMQAQSSVMLLTAPQAEALMRTLKETVGERMAEKTTPPPAAAAVEEEPEEVGDDLLSQVVAQYEATRRPKEA